MIQLNLYEISLYLLFNVGLNLHYKLKKMIAVVLILMLLIQID